MMNGKAVLCCNTCCPTTAVDLACFIFLPSQLLQKVQFKQKKYLRKAVIFGTHFEGKLPDLSKEEETVQEHVLKCRRQQFLAAGVRANAL